MYVWNAKRRLMYYKQNNPKKEVAIFSSVAWFNSFLMNMELSIYKNYYKVKCSMLALANIYTKRNSLKL